MSGRNARRAAFAGSLVVAALAAGACSDGTEDRAAVCALLDVSGTYAGQSGAVSQTMKAGVLSEMRAGDTLFVLQIDSDSYDHNNVVATLRTDVRPLEANAQKLALAKRLDAFASDQAPSQFTDISGAMLLCADYLATSPARSKMMLVFSDMREELPQGVSRTLGAHDLDDIDVAAVNVIKLRGDNLEPTAYRARLTGWQRRVESAGAKSWALLLDPAQVPEYLESKR